MINLSLPDLYCHPALKGFVYKGRTCAFSGSALDILQISPSVSNSSPPHAADPHTAAADASMHADAADPYGPAVPYASDDEEGDAADPRAAARADYRRCRSHAAAADASEDADGADPARRRRRRPRGRCRPRRPPSRRRPRRPPRGRPPPTPPPSTRALTPPPPVDAAPDAPLDAAAPRPHGSAPDAADPPAGAPDAADPPAAATDAPTVPLAEV